MKDENKKEATGTTTASPKTEKPLADQIVDFMESQIPHLENMQALSILSFSSEKRKEYGDQVHFAKSTVAKIKAGTIKITE